MNSVFRLVWNTSNACWQAVAETARGRHKNTTKTGVSTCTLILLNIARFNFKPLALSLAIGLFGASVYAEPTGGQVTAGAGMINQAGTVTTINQQTQNMAIDWHSFNVRANEAVNFNQPNASAIALNRVTGTESSSIMGSLTANGKVFILNPNGVLFGAGAEVNVGGLVASTLNLSNENFMAGNFNFTGNGIGNVVNHGNINIANGGTLAFIAPVVKNNGTIVANNGRVLLAAADDVTLTLQDGNMVSYTLNKGSVQSMIDSGGLIQANGGHVIITTKGLDALSKSAINQTGIIEAQTVNNNNGVIELLGDMEIGTLNVAGTLDASAPIAGDGGLVETSAADVNIADDINVTTKAENGETGTWLIDPVDFTVAATGGDITGSALANNLNNNNVTIQSFAGANGSNGDININEFVEWSAATTLTLNAYNDINFNKSISASNPNGKLALEYGQGAAAEGNTSTYNINAAIGLQAGFNFSTKQGSDGVTSVYKVIKFLGSETATSGFTLQSIRSDPSANYALGSSISASTTAGWNNGLGFDPIDGFTGKFDGLGHNISNLTINRPTEISVGLFGDINGATIKNVSLFQPTITGGASVGALVGIANGASIIDNSHTILGEVYGDVVVGGLIGLNEGNVVDSSATTNAGGIQSVGGLVGRNEGQITNSYAMGDISGNNAVGGLVGFTLVTGSIDNSYATGNVNGGSTVGGLIGQAQGVGSINNTYATGSVYAIQGGAGGLVGFNEVNISNSYASGNVASDFGTMVGGLVGYSDSGNKVVNISNVYATGDVIGRDEVGGLLGSSGINTSISYAYATGRVSHSSGNGLFYVGGLVGANFTDFPIERSFWDMQTSDQIISSGGPGDNAILGGIGKTTAEMQQQATYTGWDFNNVWRIQEGSSYPLLRALTQGTIIIDPTKPNLGITAPNVSKIYDGIAVNTVADLSGLTGWNGGATASGLLGSDSIADASIFSGTLRYDGTWQGAVNAGDYSIVPAGLSSQKYVIDYINGNLKINPKEIEVGTLGISADNKTKIYGEADPAFTWQLNQGQLIGTDTITGSLTRESGEDVRMGGYSITQGSLTAGSNYTINFTDGVLTIDPRPLILQAQDTSMYFGDFKPTRTSVISVPINGASGLVNNDLVNDIDFNFSGIASFSDVDTKHTITISNAKVLNGAKDVTSNYDIQYQSAELTVEPDTYKNFGYWKDDGLTNAEYNRLLRYEDVISSDVKRDLDIAYSAYVDGGVPQGLQTVYNSKETNSGFFARAYLNTEDGKIYIAFRGSENPLTNANDWVNNYVQWRGGLSPQYIEALEFTKEIQALWPHYEIKLTGHSLGGGLAMYVAGWTGLNATTFNAAKLNNTLVLNIETREGYTALFNVDNYVFDNELVQSFNDQYIGSLHLINVGTEGSIGDHLRPHIYNVISSIAQNASSKLQADFLPGFNTANSTPKTLEPIAAINTEFSTAFNNAPSTQANYWGLNLPDLQTSVATIVSGGVNLPDDMLEDQ